jgi:hypothetical protein
LPFLTYIAFFNLFKNRVWSECFGLTALRVVVEIGQYKNMTPIYFDVSNESRVTLAMASNDKACQTWQLPENVVGV